MEHSQSEIFDNKYGVDIGERVRSIRTEKNIKIESFAEQLDRSVSYVGLIERGQRIPNLASLVSICKILDVSLD